MTTDRKIIDTSSTTTRTEQQYNHGNDYYYNNIPARARARDAAADELPGNEIMHRIATCYKANVNPMITAVAAGIIERALKHGMEPETIIKAIEETGMASRPSPYYLSAVLRNWAESGVTVTRTTGQADVRTTEARPWWR